jgi:hypothetical protein
MTYKKFEVDNVTCSRRFHLTTDDQAPRLPRVEVKCQFCNAVIFQAENHPAVTLAREENLVKTTMLAETIVTQCNFKDTLSERTVPKDLKGPLIHVEPSKRP